MNDATLLTRFARDGSADAFRELVARHTSLVYACALQRLRDAHAAQDVTQAVWIALALKAKDLRPDTPLPGWLYKATRFACGKYQRGEQRRKEREMRAFEQQQTDADVASARQWDQLAPHLQVALDALSSADREVVLMRFYGKSSHRQIGECLNLSEDAAEKRVSRAVDKLRRCFSRRGVTLTGTALGGLLMAHAAPAAPVALVATAGTAALAGAGGTLASTTSTLMLAKGALHAMFIAKVKTVSLTAAACLVVAGSGIVAAKQMSASPSPTTTVTPSSRHSPAGPAVGVTAAGPAAAPVKQDAGLAATVKAAKPEFLALERPQFVVTFANPSKSDVVLPAQEGMGGQTVGQYRSVIRNVATDEKWQYRPTERSSVRGFREVLKAGATLDFRYGLAGTFSKDDGSQALNRLPSGQYELALTIAVDGATLTPKPAVFTIGAAPAAAGPAVWGEAVDGVQAGVAVMKPAFAIGEPIEFEIHVRNQSRRPVALDHAGSLVSLGPLHRGWVIGISSSSERKAWLAEWKPTGKVELEPAPVELPVGGATRLSVSLEEGSWEFKEMDSGRDRSVHRERPTLKTLPEGWYAVWVSYSQGRPTDTEWWGSIIAGSDSFTIGNPPPAPVAVPSSPLPARGESLEQQKARELKMKQEAGR